MSTQKELKAELLPAFQDEVYEGQQFFRLALKMMSEPGLIISSDNVSHQYSKVDPRLTLIWPLAQSLIDEDCQSYIFPSLSETTLLESLRFHTGAKFYESAQESEFIFLNLQELESFDDFYIGDIESPHKSSTLIIYVDEISSDSQLELSGPGIKEKRSLKISGICSQHIKLIQENHKHYPCGIDFIFCSSTAMVAIPRSTTVHTIMESC
jgi:alpha-D-ribose 1-methylphosphonate 5-triphosphate synthase subunit PhnH